MNLKAVVLMITTSKGKATGRQAASSRWLARDLPRDWKDPRYAEPQRGYMMTHVPTRYDTQSQGQTLEKVYIDLGRGALASGQTYAALSRCTSLEGILRKRLIRRDDIIVDSRIPDAEMRSNIAN